MGCPVNKVVKTGGGSALMCQADAATALVEAVVEAVDVPVTVKMRLGWDDETLTAPALARAFEQVGVAGGDHPRPDPRAGVPGGRQPRRASARWSRPSSAIPVVGNGDIRTLADAAAMFRETGCAAISIGRGALSNPFLFRQLAHWAEHGDPGPEPDLRRAGRPDGPATSTGWSSAAASGMPASSSASSSSGTATRSARPRSSTTA